MKINRSANKKLNKQLKEWKREAREGEGTSDVKRDETSFDRVVSQETIQLLDMEVQDLVVEIKKRGSVLTEQPTMQNLRRYKEAMSSFLKKSLHLSREVTTIRGKRPNLQAQIRGQEEKTHHIVQTIDEKLDQLTGSIVKKEQGRVEVTDMVGEIKGLVVDLVKGIRSNVEDPL